MSYYIFRNFTLERLFDNLSPIYSDYGDIFSFTNEYDNYIWFYHPPIKTTVDELLNEINDYSHKLEYIVSKIEKSKLLIIFQLDFNLFFRFFESDYRLEDSINLYNQKCRQLTIENKNVKTISFSNFISKYPKDEIVDWKYYYISQMYINPKLTKDFQQWFNLKLETINSKRKKCIVLDLDNTLWGGILGEDGINGVQIGQTYPGNAFLEFQQNLLNASRNGVILAICSKNNEEDVLELWQKNEAIILKQENISAWRINWESKVQNIQEIADELNIGLDSMIFIDDNPVEREAMKAFLPQVSVPDFPNQPYLLQDFFNTVYNTYFQAYSITLEDTQKTQQYLDNTQRIVAKKTFESIDQYLESLEIEIKIQTINDSNLTRIAQLTQKTNQFNLTTKRYTESEIFNFASNNSDVQCAAVKDKFGDNGITILSIITFPENDTAIIDTFLLSCRILGRGIEITYLKYILNKLILRGTKKIIAKYIPTLKNKQVEHFYEQFGFQLSNESNNEYKVYEIINPKMYEIKNYYNISQ